MGSGAVGRIAPLLLALANSWLLGTSGVGFWVGIGDG